MTHIYQQIVARLQVADGIPLLLLRLYLAPVMIQAGWNKASSFDSIVDWFGNDDYGLGLPIPLVMAFLATAAELVGGVLLLLGALTRLVSIPLMVTMIVAMVSVHAKNGWLAIADASSWLADGTILLNENIMAAPEKLAAAKSLLQEHGHYDWLTSSGNFVVLNNGIEFAATYFIMLLVLFIYGGGRFFSVDYYVNKAMRSKSN
ncbi:DoxX family protein [Alteromonas macleodii]|uniref:HvfX family Cu-binding RiPP maturation protein n=1 Tax=Alteromonas TaxID=226 RepID=UPI00248D7C49|nr:MULTISPECIES: DoxX family protein [Alteromonas]MDW5286563.1 DoxX family protein [Alteromonas macleodii]MEC8489559.1 DoxX family protein [Pseudomonadota bacterium]MED5425156.1 DoxX family protein [Pseudomonadota bacterium]